MIEMFITLLTIYVIGLVVFYCIKGLVDLFFCGYAKQLSTDKPYADKNMTHDSKADAESEDEHISEEQFFRLRKRFLQINKTRYYNRGEGDKWEEEMKKTEEKLSQFD